MKPFILFLGLIFVGCTELEQIKPMIQPETFPHPDHEWSALGECYVRKQACWSYCKTVATNLQYHSDEEKRAAIDICHQGAIFFADDLMKGKATKMKYHQCLIENDLFNEEKDCSTVFEYGFQR